MILFTLNASYIHYSHALVCLKNALEENGLPCTVYESNINENDGDVFYNLYRLAKTDKVIGFSCYIWNIEKILAITEQLKKLLPDITVIYGGPEVSYDFDKPAPAPRVFDQVYGGRYPERNRYKQCQAYDYQGGY